MYNVCCPPYSPEKAHPSQEDDILFCRTMRGVMQNIAHLCTRSKSKTWGKEGWKKVRLKGHENQN